MIHVLKQAQKLVIPSKKLQNQQTKVARLAYNLVKENVIKYPQVVGVEFGGSYSKGTWLADKADIDIFIKFNNSTSEKEFKDLSKKIGFDSLKNFHPYVRYSEHPYVEAKINGTKVNVVPCYDVKKGQWKSAADRSPFHTQFMLESLTGSMKNEVRLLKEFLRSNEIYGAEIARQGFSGYVVEVLIWSYGTFKNVIKTFADLKPNHIVGNSTKQFDTIISIIDPVDDNRNLAAAISIENIGKFVLLCRAFLKKPSISFFRSRLSTATRNLDNVLVIRFNYKPRSPDIIWGQIKRAATSLSTQMELERFRVLRSLAVTDEKGHAGILFLLQSKKLDDLHLREGPLFISNKDSSTFISKNVKKSKIMWVGSDGRILSLQKRRYTDARLFLNDLLKNHLNKSGIPKGLKPDLRKGFRVSYADKVSNKFIKKALAEMTSTNETIFFTN